MTAFLIFDPQTIAVAKVIFVYVTSSSSPSSSTPPLSSWVVFNLIRDDFFSIIRINVSNAFGPIILASRIDINICITIYVGNAFGPILASRIGIFDAICQTSVCATLHGLPMRAQ